MPIGPFTRSVGRDLSLAQVAASLVAQAHLSCFLTPEAACAVPAAWTSVYKLAYEKAVASLAPSRFQVMLQPCMN
ncbi:MAG: hypothetical protein ACLP7Q_12095 [Isosphaeraceae bacterium]